MTEVRPEKQACSVSVEPSPHDPVEAILEAVEVAFDTLAPSFPEPTETYYTLRFDFRTDYTSEEREERLFATVTAQPRKNERA